MSTEGAALWRESHDNSRKARTQDEERQFRAGQYIDTGKTQISDLRDLEKAGLKDSQQYKDLQEAHGNTQAAFNELYHPIKSPGAIQQDWHYLLGKIKGITAPKDKSPASITSQAPAMTVNTPTAPITTPALPAYQQTTPALALDDNLHTHPGSVTTDIARVATTTLPGMTAPPLTITQSFADKPAPGMVSQGNLDLSKRPNIDNGDGTHSSTFSMSFGTDKGEVLVPGVGDGKTYPERQLRVLYTLPDGSQKWAVPGNQPHNWIAPQHPTPQNNEALNQYHKTGKNFGTFEDDKAADAYGKTLHEDQEKYGNDGLKVNPASRPAGNITLPAGPTTKVTQAPAPSWGQAQVLKQKAAAMQKAQKEVNLLVAGAPLSPDQQAVSQAHAQSAARYANLQGDMAAWDKDNPNAPKDDRNAQYNQLYQKWFGTTGKGSWKNVTGTITDPTDPNKKVHVSYSFNSNTNQYANTDGTPVRPELLSSFTPDVSASGGNEQDYQDAVAKGYEGSRAQFRAEQAARGRGSITGLKYDKATGQISDPATGKRYNATDEYNPPEVSEMFKQQASVLKKQQDFQLKMAGIRGAAYNMTKPMIVLDTANGNAPSVATFGDMQKNPGRYVPASEADKAMAKENLMQDIAGSSKAARKAINSLKDDFPVEMKTKMIVAMKSEDPPAELDQLFASGALGSLTSDQQDVFVALQQLAEQGMAMRSVLGAGQGSDSMRAAMRTTLPSVLGPSKAFAMKQLDAFDATVARLHRGVPNVKLNETPMTGTTPKHTIKIGDKKYTYNGSGATDDMKNYTEVKN